MNNHPEKYSEVSVDRHASEYNMSHKKRGMAILIINANFDRPALKPIAGSDVDCSSLRHSLTLLHFDVSVYKDLSHNEIHSEMERIAKMDHRDNDCILIAILSHGAMGEIYARDYPYKLFTICNLFTAASCPTLAGKPKLFFVQACRGSHRDAGVMLQSCSEQKRDSTTSYKIPLHADFLIAYSTNPGYVSWASPSMGSWFIQSLCQELDKNGKKYDILKLLTFVIQRVAIDFETNVPSIPEKHQKKQIPSIVSMLTRLLFFNDK